MADKGWIHKFAFENNALSADTDGRAAMQDSYIQNAKIADSQITATKLASGNVLATGVYGSSRYGNCVYA
mgnify:CR=1 FL=1